MIIEQDIKIRTANEAREAAEDQAKTATVAAMVGAASQLEMAAEGPQAPEGQAQVDPEVIFARVNEML